MGNDTGVLAHRKAINKEKATHTGLGRVFVSVVALVVLVIMPSSVSSQEESETQDALYVVSLDREDVVIPCASGCKAKRLDSACSRDSAPEVEVRLEPTELMEDTSDVWFEFIPDIGEVLENEGRRLWRVSGGGEGKYWLKVKINQGFETLDVVHKAIELTPCDCTCVAQCAGFEAAGSAERASEKEVIRFRLKQSGFFGAPKSKHSHKIVWEVENGEIVSGQGTHILKVRAGVASNGPLKVTVRATREPQDDCPGFFELTVPIEAPRK